MRAASGFTWSIPIWHTDVNTRSSGLRHDRNYRWTVMRPAHVLVTWAASTCALWLSHLSENPVEQGISERINMLSGSIIGLRPLAASRIPFRRRRHSHTPTRTRPTFGLHLVLYHPHRSASSPIPSIYKVSSHYILIRLTTAHRPPRPTSLSPRSCPPRSPSTPLSLATSRNLSSSNALGKSRTRVSPLSHQHSSASLLPVASR